MVAPTKCSTCTSNSLARKGLGRASEVFGGLQMCWKCACPTSPKFCLCLAQQAGNIHHGLVSAALSSPLQLGQLPEREITSEHGRRGPKPRAELWWDPPALPQAPGMTPSQHPPPYRGPWWPRTSLPRRVRALWSGWGLPRCPLTQGTWSRRGPRWHRDCPIPSPPATPRLLLSPKRISH